MSEHAIRAAAALRASVNDPNMADGAEKAAPGYAPVTVTYKRKRSGQERTVTWDLGTNDKNDLAALTYAIRNNASIIGEATGGNRNGL
jgi:hypothetical protein